VYNLNNVQQFVQNYTVIICAWLPYVSRQSACLQSGHKLYQQSAWYSSSNGFNETETPDTILPDL